MDYFEQLPDDILHHIIDLVSDDINTLFRLRTLSRRFHSLVTVKTKHLFLQADKFDKIFGADLESYYSYCSLELAKNTSSLYLEEAIAMSRKTNCPKRNVSQRCFNHVTQLVIELPAVDANRMKSSPNHELKCIYKAAFGKNMKSCAILWYLTQRCPWKHCLMMRKLQVMYFLLEKCAYMAVSNIVPHLENLDSLVVKDSEGNLEMVMDKEGIRECRETPHDAWEVTSTTLVRCNLRRNVYGCIDIGGGLGQGPTMVLGVAVGPHYEKFDDLEEADLARRAFGSRVDGMAIEKLLQNSTLLYGISLDWI